MNKFKKVFNELITKFSFSFFSVIGMGLIIPFLCVLLTFWCSIIFDIMHGNGIKILESLMFSVLFPPMFSLCATVAYISAIFSVILKFFFKLFKKDFSTFNLFFIINCFTIISSIVSFIIYFVKETYHDGTAGDGIAWCLIFFTVIGNLIFYPLTIITYFILKFIENRNKDFRIKDSKLIQNKFYKIITIFGAILTVLYLVLLPISFILFLTTQH